MTCLNLLLLLAFEYRVRFAKLARLNEQKIAAIAAKIALISDIIDCNQSKETLMTAWFAIAAPYIPEIIKIAKPLFTRGNQTEKSAEVMAQQIAELQTAAIQNADSVKLLATEIQHTIEALQKGASKLETKLEQAHILLIVSSTISVLSFCIAAYALAR